MASGIGRMAFDSIVQRDAPDANQGRAFAKFETRFQLSWAVAGVIPVLFTLPGPGCVPDRRAWSACWPSCCTPSRSGRACEAGRGTARRGLLADQFEAGDPQPRSVDLGRGRQGLRAGEKRTEPGLADSIDDAGRRSSCRAAPGDGSGAGRAVARCRRSSAAVVDPVRRSPALPPPRFIPARCRDGHRISGSASTDEPSGSTLRPCTTPRHSFTGVPTARRSTGPAASALGGNSTSCVADDVRWNALWPAVAAGRSARRSSGLRR